nr:transposase [Xanthomonas oryzae]
MPAHGSSNRCSGRGRRSSSPLIQPARCSATTTGCCTRIKDRHLIENFFAKLKQYRAIATRYDKTACNFLGAIYWIASVILLN